VTRMVPSRSSAASSRVTVRTGRSKADYVG
jgi:hypothetical protein